MRFALFLLTLLLLCGCSGEEVKFTGHTMGTGYHITVVASPFQRTAELPDRIKERLRQINRSMSTWQADSEINRFNVGTAPFSPSSDFLFVTRRAIELYGVTNGAWDGTVEPLVELWGFGSHGMRRLPPAPEEIQAVLGRIGFDGISVDAQGRICKKSAGLAVDYSSIAKGYGVDSIARLLRDNGFDNFMVEIGGEVFAAGHNASGRAWRIGINRPAAAAERTEVFTVVAVENRCVATSGDYRKYFQADGRRYSHILNPQTGRPVTDGVVSATVIAPDCTRADGLATAMMVLGPQAGTSLANRLENVASLLIVKQKGGALQQSASASFAQFAAP